MTAEIFVPQRAVARTPRVCGVRGSVIAGAWGEPIAGVIVELWGFVDHAPVFVATTVSDRAGKFTFDTPLSTRAVDHSRGYEFRVLQPDGKLVYGEHRFFPEASDVADIVLRVPAVDDSAAQEEVDLDSELDASSSALSPEDAELCEELDSLTPVERALVHAGLSLEALERIDVSAQELHQALHVAIEHGVVSAEQLPEIDAQVDALCRQSVEAVLSATPGSLSPSRGGVIASLDLPTEQRRQLLSRYQARSASSMSAELWDESDGGEAERAEQLSEIAICLELTESVGEDPVLIRRLHQARRHGLWTRIEDLTELTYDDWCELIEDCYHEELATLGEDAGAEHSQLVEQRASSILDQLEEIYASTYVRRALLQNEATGEGARALLSRAADHDFRTQSIRARIRSDASLAAGLVEQELESSVSQLEAVERLIQVTHRAPEIEALAAGGLDSAHRIAALWRGSFIEAYADRLGGRAQAARVHARAQTIAANNQLVAIELAQAEQAAPFVMGGAAPDTLSSVPELRDLFAGDALCDCEHCGSVYSPAAYFVDLLRYLGDAERLSEAASQISAASKAQTSKRLQYRPLDLLLARRPDLADIPLTCENTLTPLPYIDLVNEILEAKVTGQAFQPDTGKTPADVLRAIPQSTNPAAYAVLQNAVFPLSLPYHAPLEAFRAHIAHLGVSRLALLTTFTDAAPDAIEVLAESLGMSREELRLIVEPSVEPWRHWGASAPLTAAELIPQLTAAPDFMRVSGLSFTELVALCSMRFLNAERSVTLSTPAVDCDPAQVRVEGLSEVVLERMAKLIRLRRRISWSYAELDRVLVQLGLSVLDVAALQKLVAVRELSSRLQVPSAELLSLWAPLDTYGRGSAYAKLFDSRAVAWQASGEAFALRPDGQELLHTAESLDPVAPALLAAFRITHEELKLAIRTLARRGQAPRLDLPGLSAIYRVVVLARATGLALRQLEGLLRLAPPGADPFTPGEPAGAVRFLNLVQEMKASGFSADQLVYLFLHDAEPRFDPTPKPARVDAVLSSVRRALVDAFVETAYPTEIAADTLRQKLALWLDATLLDAAVEVLDPRARLTNSQRRDFFDRHLARVFVDPVAAAERLFGSAEPSAAASGMAPITPPAPDPQRTKAQAAFVLEHLLPFLRQRQLRGAIVQSVGDAIGLSGASTAHLLERVLRSRQKGDKPLIDDFAALLGTGLTGTYFDNRALEGEPKVTRLEPEIDFSWAGSPPAPGVAGTGFSARFAGRFHPKTSAEHVFSVASEGAVRLSLVLDGTERVLMDRTAGSARVVESSSEPVRLEAGRLYALRLEYQNHGGPASLALFCSTQPSSKQLVATTALYPIEGLSSFAPVEESFRRIHKAAYLLSMLGATDAHLPWLSGETRPIDLDALPTSPADETLAKAQFARFRQLAALYAFRKQLPATDIDVFEVLRAQTPAEASQRLLQATGWDAGVVDELLGAGGLAPNAPPGAEPSAQPLLLRLARAVDQQRRLGVSVSKLFAWAKTAPDARMAQEAAQAVKARYDEKRWLEVATALHDPLRIARRDALVAYLLPRLADRGVRQRNQLFEYFLIDVDMSPCMLTSRIRQAIGSVQTYYQRCLMSLELTHPRLIDESAWQWMKNYRVWEANRKVFLYPENWLEPELRDDKSPLFEALERAILQDEIKPENVEAALIDYVQGLDEIARLDVRASCFVPGTARRRGGQRSSNDSSSADGTHHVFARTFGAPVSWFHRRFEAGSWTAWQKIEADIDGDHLLPWVFHGRLHLFWASFREASKQPPEQKREEKGPIPELGKDWEIHLAYTSFHRGRWSRTRACNAGIRDRIDMPQELRIGRRRVPLRLPGSTTFPPAAYRLVARAVGPSEVRIAIWRRRIIDPSLRLDPSMLTQIGEFILDGCNGELRRRHAERVTNAANLAAHSARSRRLPAPGGAVVDGQGFALQARQLTLPSADPIGHAPLLTSLQSARARVVLTGTAADHAAPFFLQTTQQCFFAHPVGPSVPRQVLQFTRFPQFGKTRRRKARPAQARPTQRAREDWGFDEEADDETFAEVVRLEPAAELSASERDQWEDEEDEAWHPEDAAARRAPRARSVPRTARRAPRVAPVRAPVQTRTVLDQKMRFVAFQHPRSCELLSVLKSDGLEGLFEIGRRARDGSSFQRHGTTALVDPALPKDDLDFDLSSPYGLYNWELFFHAPLLIALRLSKEGRHEEAQRFFHFVFDPTADDSDPSPKRFWRFAPLKLDRREGARRIVAGLSRAKVVDSPAARNLHAQFLAWIDAPFKPHVVARLRPAAYQKSVVVKYIDNLLAWGDRLFRQDTLESIQEATQLYVLASNIMGPRPERIDRIVTTPPTAFRAISDKGNLFANWMVQFETSQVRAPFQITVRPDHRGITQALRLETEYFCVPPNTQLEKYWDTVQDRLHKIRNCMNIQGTVRQLPLFEPPLDPGALVRAAAAGTDLSSVLSSLNAPPPQHRFSFLLRRALTLAEELRSFGQAALKTLERKDGEALAALRATNENKLQRAIRDVRKLQVKHVEEELAQLGLQREELELRIQYLSAQTQELMNPQERASQAAMALSKAYTIVTEGIELASKVAYAIPEIQSGGAGISSPFVTLQLGGQMFGSITSAVASTVQKLADRSEVEASLAEAQAEYQRRRAEWQQELDLVNKEKAQLDKQIAATHLSLEIANKEIQRHDLEVESSAKIEAFLRTKFTSEQLYGWMLSQLAAVHFQVYKFAFDAAQQAQRAFQFERGDASASFIEFAYWDSLRRGLFAGERLLLDLRRLEAAHLEADRRALEVTRHLSLRDDFPLSFEELIGSGRCELDVTEPLLDGDFPGHYARRIKTVSLSVAAPAKPLCNVNATLTLLSSRIRIDAGAGGNYGARDDGDDARFANKPVPVQAIATSQMHNDAGLFQLRFDDDRYLPFEGAGAVSRWRLVLPQEDNALDIASFDDVVLSLAYTARDGGAPLAAAARAHRLRELAQGSIKPPLHQRLSLRREQPELFRQISELKAGQETEAKLSLTAARLPGRYRPFEVRVERVHVFVHVQAPGVIPADALRLRVEPPRAAPTPVSGFSMPWPSSKSLRVVVEAAGSLGEWKIGVGLASGLSAEVIRDIVLHFELRVRG